MKARDSLYRSTEMGTPKSESLKPSLTLLLPMLLLAGLCLRTSAGDTAPNPAAATSAPQVQSSFALPADRSVDDTFRRALVEEEANQNLAAAIQGYREVIAALDAHRQMEATALFRLGECYRKQGKINEALAQYRRVLTDFYEQATLVNLIRETLTSPRSRAPAIAPPTTVPTGAFFSDSLAAPTTNWLPVVIGSGPSITFGGGEMTLSFPSNSTPAIEGGQNAIIAAYNGRLSLVGNFDAQVDYRIDPYTPVSGHPVSGLRVQFGYTNNTCIAVQRVGWEGYDTDVYLFDIEGNILSSVPTSDLSGTLRLVRQGTQISGYYKSATGWNPVAAGADPSGVYGPVQLNLAASFPSSAFPGTQMHAYFSNFRVNADNITGLQVVPPGYRPPTNGLVGWWRGEGNANDETGKHNGTLLNGVAFDTGEFGQAFSLGGTSTRVLVPDSVDLMLTNSLSIGAWIYPKANSYNVVARNGNDPNRVAYGIGGPDFTGQFTFHIAHSPAEETLYAPQMLNQWIHLAGTLDGATGDMRLYTNGVLAAQKSATVRPLGFIDPSFQPGLAIGNASQGGWPFIGLVDEVVLYSRALSPAEVASLALTKLPATDAGSSSVVLTNALGSETNSSLPEK